MIGTGAQPVRPPITGLDQLCPADGLHLLHTIGDTLTLTATLARNPQRALIVAVGYMGLASPRRPDRGPARISG